MGDVRLEVTRDSTPMLHHVAPEGCVLPSSGRPRNCTARRFPIRWRMTNGIELRPSIRLHSISFLFINLFFYYYYSSFLPPPLLLVLLLPAIASQADCNVHTACWDRFHIGEDNLFDDADDPLMLLVNNDSDRANELWLQKS